ncbi:MAG: bifunctional riboflavin kinase/FAD synthetase [Chloroflexi bacterium]|nr:bifunctional riboflavin kinase/FAD synthetase [Chloroflexota bacterium]
MNLPSRIGGCPVYTDLGAFGGGEPTALTLGRFDGVHEGHRALLRATLAAARESPGTRAVAVTLWPPPEWLLRPTEPRALLTTLHDRLALLATSGVDAIVVLSFDREFAQQSPLEFLTRLRDEAGMRDLVSGPNARIGKGGAGTPSVLRSLSRELGFRFREIVWHGPAGTNRSSTIRAALARGDIAAANGGLGRTYSLEGMVVRGAGEGLKLGFATANVSHADWLCVPGDGVYAGLSVADGSEPLRAAISIGTRPTYGEHPRVVEAHVLDAEGDFYDRPMRLFFVSRLRPQRTFSDTGALAEAIAVDIAAVRAAPLPSAETLAPFVRDAHAPAGSVG